MVGIIVWKVIELSRQQLSIHWLFLLVLRSLSFSHLLGNSLDEVLYIYDMSKFPDMPLKIFERLQHLIANEAVSRQF